MRDNYNWFDSAESSVDIASIICDTVLIIAMAAIVLFFLWKVLDRCLDLYMTCQKHDWELNAKNRQLQADYREKLLSLLEQNITKEKAEKLDDDKYGTFKTSVESYITACEQSMDKNMKSK